jgi:hypothetical protein
MQCNTTAGFLYTPNGTYDYYNYSTIFLPNPYTDVCLTLKPLNLKAWYNLTFIGDYGVCQSTNNVTGLGAPGTQILKCQFLLDRGVYYFLTGGKTADPVLYLYNITIDCGSWCGNGVIDSGRGEQCDISASYADNNGRCQPYQECRKCKCANLTVSGCSFYDWCTNGVSPINYSMPCCINSTGNPDACCINAIGNPWLNCSEVNYRRNPNANASYFYCNATGFDVTDLCIDVDANNHTIRSNCVF